MYEANSNLEEILSEIDPSNSTIFIMTDITNTGTGGGYFSRGTARTEAKVLAKQAVVPKDKRGVPGSRERGIHYSAATGALEQMFGASSHFVPTSREGGPDTYHKIQEIYVGNLHKLKGVRGRRVKYNMNDPLKILSMIDETTTNPAVIWGYGTTKRYLLVHWYQINLGEVISFQCNTNLFAAEEDMTSSDWVEDLLVNSIEAALSQLVEKKFQQI